MTHDKFISYFFIALLVFVVSMVIYIFSPFFKAIFWSAILAFTFYPVYAQLNRLLKNETVSSLLMTVLIFLLVIPPVIYLIVNLSAQAIDLYPLAADYVREGRLEALIDHVRSFHVVQNIEDRLVQWEPLKQNLNEWMLSSARAVGNYTAAQAGTITKNVFFVILNILMMFFLVFVFLKDGNAIYSFIYEIVPLEEKHKYLVFQRISETFSAVIRGQLLTSLAQATVAGIIYWAIGLPLSLFFAMLTFITSMIPMVGTTAVWLPLVIYLAVTHQYMRAGLLAVLGFFVIGLIDNFIKPALIGKKTHLPYFLLFFGILGGIKFFGLMGIFLAPVLLSLFFALIAIYREKSW
ncbi:AI-2E family transporter [Candidatus Kuenenia sp.]|uniref:AI-2E family transporter n=1 Tax=Candidatus Kuenenia sp. TaxID=2499824 RepID=UPI00321FC2F7